MQVKNGEIWQARQAFGEILKEHWPLKTAYGLVKVAKKVNEHCAVIDAVQNTLIRQYGTEGENGQISVLPNGENWPAFIKEFNELMDKTEELDAEKVVLPSDNGASVSAMTLMNLEPFVEIA